MTLSAHVATLGRGPGRSRALTRDEAADAMRLMLRDDTAPEAIGALLMLLRMKGETDAEIAGLASAAQAGLPSLPMADLDWPSYAAGRTRGLPWFLLSARLVAMAGHRVMLHGINGTDASVRAHLTSAGILDTLPGPDMPAGGIAYLPLEQVHPRLHHLLSLRPVLGLRSCINTVCRMLNPSRAAASVQGVFHPSYRLLQADAARLMGWQNLTVIKGGGGEFERLPGKDIAGFGLRDGAPFEQVFPALNTQKGRLSEVAPGLSLSSLWSGAQHDQAAADIVIGTAALALDTLGDERPETRARQLWNTRPTPQKETAA